MIVLGYDPGGAGKSGKRESGIAFLDARDGRSVIKTSQCASVERALTWFERECGNSQPSAIGIDTFLHWATAEKGWRPVDQILKRNYPSVQSSVQPTNSTAGSMVVQGMALAIVAREKWQGIALNEVHPKVLFSEFEKVKYPRDREVNAVEVRTKFIEAQGFSHHGNITSEDEFDAAICCIATAKGRAGAWQNLMDVGGSDAKVAPLVFPVGHVDYYWPRRLD